MKKLFDVTCHSLVFKKMEWKLIEESVFSKRKKDLVNSLNVSMAYVNRLLSDVRDRARLYPVFDYPRMGLAHVVLFLRESSDVNLATYSRSFSLVEELGGRGEKYNLIIGLVPYDFVDDYIAVVGEPVFAVKGLEYRAFNQSNKSFYKVRYADNKKVEVIPALSKLNFSLDDNNKPERPKSIRVPDPIDLAIMVYRYTHDVFMRPVNAVKKAIEDSVLFALKWRDERYLTQLVAYHFNSHYDLYWKYNSVYLSYDTGLYPPIAILLTGEQHYVVARILSSIPFFHRAVIGEDSSFVTGFLYSPSFKRITEIINRFDVEWRVFFVKRINWRGMPKLYELVGKRKSSWKWIWESSVIKKVRR